MNNFHMVTTDKYRYVKTSFHMGKRNFVIEPIALINYY